MSSNTVAQFAIELKMPANVLLEQLRGAGVDLKSVDDNVTDGDKARLLESLRRSHGATEGKKITLTRRQTTEIRQADGSGKSRTIQVEVRKKRVFVKRDTPETADVAPVEPIAAPAIAPVVDAAPVQAPPTLEQAVEIPATATPEVVVPVQVPEMAPPTKAIPTEPVAVEVASVDVTPEVVSAPEVVAEPVAAERSSEEQSAHAHRNLGHESQG
jgi:translation initiation factor IF-2